MRGGGGGGGGHIGPNIVVFWHTPFILYLITTYPSLLYHYIYGFITVVKGSFCQIQCVLSFVCVLACCILWYVITCMLCMCIMLCIHIYIMLYYVMSCYILCVNEKISSFEGRIKMNLWTYDVTRRDPLSVVMVCWFTHSQFHSWRYKLRITLKYTSLVPMSSGSAWTGIHDNGVEVTNSLQ